MAQTQHAPKQREGAIGIKETLSSIIIAFMLAFLFRGFVIEGFLIPTGSMAPTLLGKHIRMQSPQSGYDWTVGPWTHADRRRQMPIRNQTDIQVQDPMSGIPLAENNRRLAAGDRVFVLKYLPWLHHPQRWDVVVFKNPGQHTNYIKRLVGLPGEQIAIVDGDVFTRPFVEGKTARSGWDAWTHQDWSVQRKPERVQRAMLQDVFDSSYAPTENLVEYRSPLSPTTGGWSGIEAGGVYTYDSSARTTLEWNNRRPLTDMNPYNQVLRGIDLFAQSDDDAYPENFRPFPIADLTLSANIRPQSQGLLAMPTIEARGMLFRARVDLGTGTASVEMRDASAPDAPWAQLDEGAFSPPAQQEWTNIEFWHIDQALWLFIDHELVAGGPQDGTYRLTPAQRAAAATTLTWEQLQNKPGAGDGRQTPGVLSDSTIYRKPTLRWDFEGGAFTLTHVRVQRDIAYQVNPTQPTRAAHPEFYPTLDNEQFFMCGDNSSNSADSRLWGENEIDPWVYAEIDNTPGSVHRDLIVGKAFVVYFPAPLDDGPILSVDFGRLRWIW